MLSLAGRALIQHAMVHAPVIATQLAVALEKGMDLVVEPGPGSPGSRAIYRMRCAGVEWATKVAQREFPLMSAAGGARADAPAPKSLLDRLNSVMRSVLSGDFMRLGMRDADQQRDDLAPVAAGKSSVSAAFKPYESRADAERYDVATLVALGGVVFNFQAMPAGLRSQIEEELARNMAYYKRIAMPDLRLDGLDSRQLHGVLTLAVVRTQQRIRAILGGKPETFDCDALDARCIVDGRIDGQAFEDHATAGPPQVRAASAATALAAGLGMSAIDQLTQQHPAVRRWLEQVGPRYVSVVDVALGGETYDRAGLRLVDSDDERVDDVRQADRPTPPGGERPGYAMGMRP